MKRFPSRQIEFENDVLVQTLSTRDGVFDLHSVELGEGSAQFRLDIGRHAVRYRPMRYSG